MTLELKEKILQGFHPTEHGLPEDFVLTKLTAMKGCGCKILLDLLKTFGEDIVVDNDAIGIGLDSCVIPLRHPGLNLVQTTDFFYPLVDDPYLMGRITCANVLSDLYAMGVTDCDNMLMLLGVSVDLKEQERNTIVEMIIAGFKEAADLAETKVRGGQTVRCPWLLLGGVASSVVKNDEMIRVDRAKPGDLLVLTKALGGQVAVNSYEWIKTRNGRVDELNLDTNRIVRAFQQATEQMCRLNKNAAKLLHKYNAHASTDVTGFGIIGHADNLAKAQQENVRFVIDKLPIIEYMDEISKKMANGNGFNLFTGTSAETSGGLLIALSAEDAEKYVVEIEELDGFPAWIIGHVEASKASKEAIISSDYTVETMHFVKKEPTTEEERLAKEKQRAVKLGKYLTARNRIFEKNRAEEFDEELLLLTQAVLSKNPDISTFWNLRRKTIDLMIHNLTGKDDSAKEINRLLNAEMGLTHECLMQANPKSYGAWHHRGWTLERFISTGLEADFKSELALCKKALDFDCRNFHCWDHRRIVSKLAKCTDEEELGFSLDRINHNFSNYSAWHYRSVLLPRVQLTNTGSPSLDEALLNEELEKIANAFSCDPEDQSAFVYARWLLSLDSSKTFMHSSSSDPPLPLSITFNGRKTVIVMSKAAKMEEILQFVQISDQNLLIPLSTASVKPRSAVVWELRATQKFLSRLDSGDEWVYSDSLVNTKRMKIAYDCDINRAETLVARTLMAKLEELMSIPPISAWTKYTYALCLMELNPVKHHSKIVEILGELAGSMDCKRRELYKAIISRLTICHTLREEIDGRSLLDKILEGEENCLNLQRKEITSLSGIEFLAGFLETLILGENELRDLNDILLPRLENLTVSENPITSIPALPCLHGLKSLNIAGTAVTSLDSIVSGLKALPNLEKLIICETAVVEDVPQLHELLGNTTVRIINYWL